LLMLQRSATISLTNSWTSIMKLHRVLIALGLTTCFAPSISFAGCSPACKTGETCRYEAAGNYFYCASSSVKGGVGARAPGRAVSGDAVRASTQPSSGSTSRAAKRSNNAQQSPSSKSTDASSAKRATAINSPRAAASGQATGRRQHTP
jgi:hypothetical protein